MQALGPSLLPFQDEPSPGAGEQMRWSYWAGWATRAQTGPADKVLPKQGFPAECLIRDSMSLTSCAVHIMMCV